MRGAIGLVVAMEAEARALVGPGRWDHGDPYPFQCSSLTDTIHLIVVRSGIGWENASGACRWIIRQGVGALGAVGVCAGLAPRLVPGDLILADVIMEEKRGGFNPIWAEGSGFGGKACGAIKKKGLSACAGPIVTVRRPILHKEEKASLYQQSRAVAADMESGAAALAASRASLPFFTFRAVCDGAGRSIPASLFEALYQEGRVRPWILVRRLLFQPTLFLDILAIGRDFRAALTSLRQGWNGSLKFLVTSLIRP